MATRKHLINLHSSTKAPDEKFIDANEFKEGEIAIYHPAKVAEAAADGAKTGVKGTAIYVRNGNELAKFITEEAIDEKVNTGVGGAVTSFAGKKGEITIDETAHTKGDGNVTFTMSENKLTGSVSLGTAAGKDFSDNGELNASGTVPTTDAVKTYVGNTVGNVKITATGDTYVDASVDAGTGRNITVKATEATVGLLGKAGSSIQGVTADGTYLQALNETDDKHRKISANVAKTITGATENQLADALSVKGYVEGEIGKAVTGITGAGAITVTEGKAPEVSLKLDASSGDITFSQTKESGLSGAVKDGSIGNAKISDVDGNKVSKLTGYLQAGKYIPVTPEDTLTAALGKLEKGHNENKTKIDALSSATKFIGKFDVLPGTPEAPEGVPAEGKKGDIVIVGNKEYIYNGEDGAYIKESWVELGDTTAESGRISALEETVNGTGEPEKKGGLVQDVAALKVQPFFGRVQCDNAEFLYGADSVNDTIPIKGGDDIIAVNAGDEGIKITAKLPKDKDTPTKVTIKVSEKESYNSTEGIDGQFHQVVDLSAITIDCGEYI